MQINPVHLPVFVGGAARFISHPAGAPLIDLEEGGVEIGFVTERALL